MASESTNGRFLANSSTKPEETATVLPYLRSISQLKYQNQCRTLLITDDSVLGIGLVTLLKQEIGLNFSSISAADKTAVLKTVHSFHPDVIVLIEAANSIRVGTLMSFLSDISELRLICVNHEDNYVKIYELHQQPLHQISDFMSAITSFSFSQFAHNTHDEFGLE